MCKIVQVPAPLRIAMPTARLRAAAVLLLGLLATPATAAELTAPPAHGYAMHGDLKYGPHFTHFQYTHPEPPQGGTIVTEAPGSFHTFNPFVLPGHPAAGAPPLYYTLPDQQMHAPVRQVRGFDR